MKFSIYFSQLNIKFYVRHYWFPYARIFHRKELLYDKKCYSDANLTSEVPTLYEQSTEAMTTTTTITSTTTGKFKSY